MNQGGTWSRVHRESGYTRESIYLHTLINMTPATSFYCTVCDGGVAADGRSLAICVSCQMACVHALVRRLLHCTEQIFPICFCFIAHLSKTVDVVIFSFVRVHLKHHATFSPCDRWPLPRKCSSSLSRQHACVSLTVEMGAHRPSLQSESRCSLHGNGRVRNRLSRKHLSIALMQT